MNILDLLKQDGFKPQKESTNYSSPCPGCGGVDRFVVWPDQGQGGRYWCRHCQKSGDAITYVMEFQGMSYPEACEFLGRELKSSYNRFKQRNIPTDYPWNPKPPESPPPEIWQKRVTTFIQDTSEILLSEDGTEIRRWLEKRGLSVETMKNSQLGLNPNDSFPLYSLWGLPKELNNQRREKKLYLPQGLVIPHMVDGKPHKLRIRRFSADTANKYQVVQGSNSNPMVLGQGESIIIVESELDAFLINQFAGDLVKSVALGSVAIKPDSELTATLHGAKIILISLDNDEAGGKAMWGWWQRYFPNSRRWPVLMGKDPSEGFQQGLDIRNWIIAGLPYLVERYVSAGQTISTDEDFKFADPASHIYSGQCYPDINYRLITDTHSLIEAVESLENHPSIAVDIKTTGKDVFICETRLIQLAAENKPVFIFDLQKFSQDDLRPLKKLFSKNSQRIFHDAKINLKFFRKMKIDLHGEIFDTMLSEQLLTAGLENQSPELYGLAKKYLSMAIPKKLQKIEYTDQLTSDQLECAARDTFILLEIHKKLNVELEKENLWNAAQLEFDCLPAVVEMELNGMKFDESKLLALHQELIEEKDYLEKYLSEELGQINFNSPEQVLLAFHSKGINLPNTKNEYLIGIFSKVSPTA